MIKTVLIFLLLIVNITHSQNTLKGKFVISQKNAFFSQRYHFSNDSLFEFREHTDIDRTFGKGKYKLIDSTLILVFESIPDTTGKVNLPCYRVIKQVQSNSDTLRYMIIVKDENGDLMVGAYTGIYDPKDNISVDKKPTNKYGKAVYAINKNMLGHELLISYAGYKSCKFQINDSSNMTIEFYLKPTITPYKFVPPKTVSYHFEKLSIKSFSISEDGKYWQKFVKDDE